MKLDVQFKLKSNPLFIKYLHENSYWYKILNRDPEMFNNFVNEVKKTYKLRPTDKINEAVELITYEVEETVEENTNEEASQVQE